MCVCAWDFVVSVVGDKVIYEFGCFLVFDVHPAKESASADKYVDFWVKVLALTAESEGNVRGSSGRVRPYGVSNGTAQSCDAVVAIMGCLTAIYGHGEYLGPHHSGLVLALDWEVFELVKFGYGFFDALYSSSVSVGLCGVDVAAQVSGV